MSAQLFKQFGFTFMFLATWNRGYLILVRGEGDPPGWTWCINVGFDVQMAVADLSVHAIGLVDQKLNLVFTKGDGAVVRGQAPKKDALFSYDCPIEDPRKLCDSDVLQLIRQCRTAIRRL